MVGRDGRPRDKSLEDPGVNLRISAHCSSLFLIVDIKHISETSEKGIKYFYVYLCLQRIAKKYVLHAH